MLLRLDFIHFYEHNSISSCNCSTMNCSTVDRHWVCFQLLDSMSSAAVIIVVGVTWVHRREFLYSVCPRSGWSGHTVGTAGCLPERLSCRVL